MKRNGWVENVYPHSHTVSMLCNDYATLCNVYRKYIVVGLGPFDTHTLLCLEYNHVTFKGLECAPHLKIAYPTLSHVRTPGPSPKGAFEPKNAALRSHLVHLDLLYNHRFNALAVQLEHPVLELKHNALRQKAGALLCCFQMASH